MSASLRRSSALYRRRDDPTPRTPRQIELYEFLYEFTRKNGFQPSRRDMCEALGLTSPNALASMIRGLIEKSWLAPITERSARCLVILRKPSGAPFDGFRD
jgi:SOS-response transcriptional repressor LexA